MDQNMDQANGSQYRSEGSAHGLSAGNQPPDDLNTSFHPSREGGDPALPSGKWGFIGGALATLGGLLAGATMPSSLEGERFNSPVPAVRQLRAEDLQSPQAIRHAQELILTSLDPSLSPYERQRAELELSELDPGAARLIPIAERAMAALPADAPAWQLDAYRDFLNTRRLGIEFPNRIQRENLQEILDNRYSLTPDGRPLAVFIYPKGDHNGAFYTATTEFSEMIQAGYRVLYFEVESDSQFIEAAFTATRLGTQFEQRADLLIIGGHGARDLLVFERDSNPLPDMHGYLDFSDEARLRRIGISRTLADGGQVILDSCSNGEGREDRDNMANMARRIFPNARPQGIWSATESYSIEHFTFDENGVLINVNFHVPEYRALLENNPDHKPLSNAADIRV